MEPVAAFPGRLPQCRHHRRGVFLFGRVSRGGTESIYSRLLLRANTMRAVLLASSWGSSSKGYSRVMGTPSTAAIAAIVEAFGFAQVPIRRDEDCPVSRRA